MGKWAALIAVAVVAALALWRIEPFLTAPREVIVSAATPEPIAAVSPLTLAKGFVACFDQVTFDPDGHIAHFTVSAGPPKGPPLELTEKAPGFSAKTRVPGGYPPGPLDIQVPTPKRSTMGSFCIRNLGKKTIQLLGSVEGRLVSRPNTTVNGQPNQIKVALRFDERKPASLVSHIPGIFSHASTLKPIPVWLVWVLAFLVVLGLPGGLIWALATATSAPSARFTGATAAPPLPFRRSRGALRGRAALLGTHVRRIRWRWLMGALLALAVVYFAYWALRVRGYQNDENEYVYLARWTAKYFPQSLWDFTTMTRGLQRLEIWLLAVPLSLFRSPLSFYVAHVLNVLAFVSAALPAYFLARGIGLSRVWRFVAAALTIVLPWAVVAVTVLTEPLAYPAFGWALWAIWRSAVLRTWRADVLALVLIAIGALARTNLALLAPLFLVTIVWQELRCGEWRLRRGARDRLVSFVRGLAVGHMGLTVAVALVVVYLLLGSAGAVPTPRSLAGGYGLPIFPISRPFLHKTLYYLAHLTTGVGFFPFVIGAPWIAARVVAPRRDPAAHALAVVLLVSMLFVLYVNSPAGTDERYIIYLAPPLVLGFVAALGRRDLFWPLALLGAAVAIFLLHHFGWNAAGGPYGFFIGSAESFYARVILLQTQRTLLINPGPVIFVLQVFAGLLAAWIVSRRRGALRATPWLVAFVVLGQVVQTQYTIGHFVRDAMGAQPPAKQRAWIDQKIYGKGTAGIYLEGMGNTPTYNPVWGEVEYWNNTVQVVVAPAQPLVQIPRDDDTYRVEIDGKTGLIKSPVRLPDYAVVPADGRAGVVGRTIAKAGYVPAELVEVDRPWRVGWATAAFDVDGYLQEHSTGVIRVFRGGVPRGMTNECLRLDALAPFGFKGRVQLHSGKLTRSAHVDGTDIGRVEIPLVKLRRGAIADDLTVTATGKPVKLSDGRFVRIQVGGLAVVGC